ncbi:MAG: DUF5666 domain-containing protein [Chloroflexota bacterium]|nr:DUF5666 domain-containing protein [Chloroflexota bacterium]
MPSRHERDPNDEMRIAEPLRPEVHESGRPRPEVAGSASDQPVSYSSRTAGPGKLRVGAITGVAVALAVGAVATSLAATPGPSSGGGVATTSRSVDGVSGLAPALAPDPVVDDLDGTFDHRRMGPGFREITISSISGGNVSLKTDDGWSRTIALTDSVKVTKGGQEIGVSDLSVGDSVRLRQTRNDDGTYTVDALVVVVPSVRGTAGSVSSTGFKVTTRDGSTWTITVNASTQYAYGKGGGSLSDVTDGAAVTVLGTSTGDNALTALTVRVAPDRAAGVVKSKTSDTIVITQRDGSTLTVHVDADTTYRVGGVATAGLGDVAVDMSIGVAGRARSDGSIDADAIMAGSGPSMFRGDGGPMGPLGGGFGRGGRGGMGPGPGGPDDDAPTASPSATG